MNKENSKQTNENTTITSQKSFKDFCCAEIKLYIAYIIIFVCVAFPHILEGRNIFYSYINNIISIRSLKDIFYTLVMITLVAMILKHINFSDKIINEAPTAIYFFGGGGTGTLLAVMLHDAICRHPPLYPNSITFKWLFTTICFSIVAFIYGFGWRCLLKYNPKNIFVFMYRRQIKSINSFSNRLRKACKTFIHRDRTK